MSTRQGVILHLPERRFAPAVAGHVVLGLALAAGFPALAADRVRREVEASVRDAGGAVEIRAGLTPGRIELRLEAASQAAAARAAAALAQHRTRLDSTQLEVHFVAAQQGGLRAV